jgi:hypothetical protein
MMLMENSQSKDPKHATSVAKIWDEVHDAQDYPFTRLEGGDYLEFHCPHCRKFSLSRKIRLQMLT